MKMLTFPFIKPGVGAECSPFEMIELVKFLKEEMKVSPRLTQEAVGHGGAWGQSECHESR